VIMPATLRRRRENLQDFLTFRSFEQGQPFGGYKASGNGREWGDYAFAEYLETKAILGLTQ